MFTTILAASRRRAVICLALGCAALLGALPAASQELKTVDPNTVIDGDLATPQRAAPAAPAHDQDVSPGFSGGTAVATNDAGELPATASGVYTGSVSGELPAAPGATPAASPANRTGTYSAEELLPPAQGVFGKGARGLGEMMQGLLKKQGQPDGYIVGKEAGGAFIFGIRYGTGTLYTKSGPPREVHWRGPSFGPDIGAAGAQTFILVYNLGNTADLFHTYAQGELQAYLVGGFHISELKRGNVVLIPVRMGAGLRLGVNVGYMKFSKKDSLIPF